MATVSCRAYFSPPHLTHGPTIKPFGRFPRPAFEASPLARTPTTTIFFSGQRAFPNPSGHPRQLPQDVPMGQRRRISRSHPPPRHARGPGGRSGPPRLASTTSPPRPSMALAGLPPCRPRLDLRPIPPAAPSTPQLSANTTASGRPSPASVGTPPPVRPSTRWGLSHRKKKKINRYFRYTPQR